MWQCAIQTPGVGDVEQDVHRLAGSHEHRVLPDEVGLRDAVAGQDDEAAGAVDVERVVHRVVGVHLVDEPQLDLVADRERQSIAWLSAPVSRSTSFQRMLAGVVIRLTSTMSSSHSIPPASCAVVVHAVRRCRVLVVLVPMVLVCSCRCGSCECPALVTSAARRSFMPHLGQRSGVSLTTSGCIGQT